ncbi:MAG: type II secretion system F family protein [Vampirovibrionales bacterium]
MDIFILSLAPWLSGLTVLLLGLGIYNTFFQKSVQAKERFKDVYDIKKSEEISFEKNQKQILKEKLPASSKVSSLSLRLEQANLSITTNEFRALRIGCSIVSGIIGFIAQKNIFIALLWAGGGGFIPEIVLRLKRWLRLARAEEQFADVLDAMISCLKTGFGFHQAVHSITENFDDPWGTEFGKMAIETSMGQNNTTILRNLYHRVPNPDVELFTTAMQIYFESGGNLVELLKNLSETIRTRYKLFRKIRTLSAQGKLSAGLVVCVPFFLMSFMGMVIPEAVQGFASHPIGIILLSITGFWMLCGIIVLFKIVKIEV